MLYLAATGYGAIAGFTLGVAVLARCSLCRCWFNVIFGAIEVHRALATALPVVAVIGMAAVAGHFLAGQRVPVALTCSLPPEEFSVFNLQLGSHWPNGFPGGGCRGCSLRSSC